jgi:hypothetical protein
MLPAELRFWFFNQEQTVNNQTNQITRTAASLINPLVKDTQAETLRTLAGIVADLGDLLLHHPKTVGHIPAMVFAVSGALEFEASQAAA